MSRTDGQQFTGVFPRTDCARFVIRRNHDCGFYFILGMHYALILGVFLAVWEIVPVIGPPIDLFRPIVVVAIDGMDTFLEIASSRFSFFLQYLMDYSG